MTRPRLQSLIRRGGDRLARSVPHRTIVAALPAAIPRQFDPSLSRGLQPTFELRVRDPGSREPARFAVVIANERCAVSSRSAPEAGAAVTVGGDDLIRLASGSASWPELLSSGRLELSGDPFLALRFPTLFRLPASVRI